MAYNLFFLDNRESFPDGDGGTIDGWQVGPKKIYVSEVFILASHNGKDLFHYITSKENEATVGRTLPEFLGDSYVEIVLKSLLGVLPSLIAKKILWLKYEYNDEMKIATVEEWETDGSPDFIKVLKPHKYYGVDVD